MSEFVCLYFSEAKEQGYEAPWGCTDWHDMIDVEGEDEYTSGIWMIDVDGSHFIGSDGGEPEDQTLGRDWAWVTGALNAAYGQGVRDGGEWKL